MWLSGKYENTGCGRCLNFASCVRRACSHVAAFALSSSVVAVTNFSNTNFFSDAANGEVFRNRKNYFSLNFQAVCNADLEMTDIVVRWPGSTHDSYIFNNSRLKRMFEEGRYGNAVLVGDSGYACKSYMMTPLDVCNTQSEHLYNESQIRTRNPIERMFGVWKRRFPAMSLGLRLSLDNSFPVIIATAVLHNIAQQTREELPPDDQELLLPAPWETLIAEGDIRMPYVPVGGPQIEKCQLPSTTGFSDK